MRAVVISRYIEEQDDCHWLVEGLLPSVGWTLFYGQRGLGKTTFAMQLCAALQDGLPFMGRKTEQNNILYVQADSVGIEWKQMLKRIAPKSKGWTLVDVPSKALGNAQYIDGITTLKEKVKPGFIVFDSLYNLTAWPINTEAVLIPINLMQTIAGDVPWLLIHHPPHSEARAAGHHSLGGKCSNEWSLLKNKLKIEKGRLVADKEILLEKDTDGLWQLRDSKQQSGGVFDTPIF